VEKVNIVLLDISDGVVKVLVNASKNAGAHTHDPLCRIVEKRILLLQNTGW
jgi:hypothetical protein